MKRDYKFIPKKREKLINLSGTEMFSGSARIEIFENRELILEGCRKVLQFNENYIKLAVKTGNLILYGKNFGICGFEDDTVTVKGVIESLEFCLREEKND